MAEFNNEYFVFVDSCATKEEASKLKSLIKKEGHHCRITKTPYGRGARVAYHVYKGTGDSPEMWKKKEQWRKQRWVNKTKRERIHGKHETERINLHYRRRDRAAKTQERLTRHR